MQFTIKINTDNDAFADNADREVGRILSKLTAEMLQPEPGHRAQAGKLYDSNGLSAGEWRWEA